jgi:FkbM family methyltransferase
MELTQTINRGLGSFIIPKGDLIGEFIKVHGVWEQHLYFLYSRLIKKTDIILDAGANIGFHSIQFGKLGSKVYSYEPQPSIFNILAANIAVNDLSEKVFPYRLGLSDKASKIKFTPLAKCLDQGGLMNYGGRGLTNDEEGEGEIEVIPFNYDVDVIKMDIQGGELYALKGMESILDKCNPWIMIENYTWAENDKEVLKFLHSKGYTIYRLMVGNNEDCFAFKDELPNHSPIKNILNDNKIQLPYEEYKNLE